MVGGAAAAGLVPTPHPRPPRRAGAPTARGARAPPKVEPPPDRERLPPAPPRLRSRPPRRLGDTPTREARAPRGRQFWQVSPPPGPAARGQWERSGRGRRRRRRPRPPRPPAPSRGRRRPAPGDKAERGGWDGGPPGAARGGGPVRARRPLPWLRRRAPLARRPHGRARPARRRPSAGPRGDAGGAGDQKWLGSLGPPRRPRPALALRAAPVEARAAAPPPRTARPASLLPSAPARRPAAPLPAPPRPSAAPFLPHPGPGRRPPRFLWDAPTNADPQFASCAWAPTLRRAPCLPSRREEAAASSPESRGAAEGSWGATQDRSRIPGRRAPGKKEMEVCRLETRGRRRIRTSELEKPCGVSERNRSYPQGGDDGDQDDAHEAAMILRSRSWVLAFTEDPPCRGQGREGRCSPSVDPPRSRRRTRTDEPWRDFLGQMAVR